MSGKMHDGEVELDVPLVRRLLREQLPQFADLSITRVRSTGTVNAIFRLGDDLCVRLPRVAQWAGDLERELEWLPRLAPHLPLAVPEPVAAGQASDGFPYVWAVYRWIAGDTYAPERDPDERSTAATLAGFVAALRTVDPAGGPRTGRRPLPDLAEVTHRAIAASGFALDVAAVAAAWDTCLTAPLWDKAGGGAVWRHGDLLPPNLLVGDAKLRAVLDFGGAGIGDPAADVVPAWSVLGPEGRDVFRHDLHVDDGVWDRARGYALHQAAMIVPYYRETNPDFVTMALRTIRQVLLDLTPSATSTT